MMQSNNSKSDNLERDFAENSGGNAVVEVERNGKSDESLGREGRR